MASNLPRPLLEIRYYKAAQEYLRNLPPEHFMEATPHAQQRKITLESLDLVQADRSDFHLFNELLVQYPFGRTQELRQVVPDNMVVVSDEPIQAETSYDVPLQPVSPFWMLEYVSKNTERKDYEESFRKYETELKVPYYLVFYPDNQELTLFHLKGRKYVSVKANDAGRHAIPELEIEVALLDGWVRFWYRGKLLPLPPELQSELDEERRRRRKAEAKLKQAIQREEQAIQEAAQARQREDQAIQEATQAREEAAHERREKAQALEKAERLLARFRALGIDPP